MGQTQGKDGDNDKAEPANPRADKKDKQKKEKKANMSVKDRLAWKLLKTTFTATLSTEKAVHKINESLDVNNWKKKPQLQHDGHFELLAKAKSSVNTETSLGLFYCLPNELLVHLSNYLSWKEALSLQASSRGLFLLLDEDLYWQGLYDKVPWKHALQNNDDLKEPINNAADFGSNQPDPQITNIPQDCCYKKKFFKRYLLPEEKKARTKTQIDELYGRIQKITTKRDSKTNLHQREFTKQINAMNQKRWMVALFCCILLALFLKPVTIFSTKLVVFTCQLPAELFIAFIERFACWRGLPVSCWRFNSKKTFASFDSISPEIRNDYLFCLPTITVGCIIQFGIWAFFQVGKLIATFISFIILAKLSLGFVDKVSQYLLQFRTFSQKEIQDRFNKQKADIEAHYDPKLKLLRSRVEQLRSRPEMQEPVYRSSAPWGSNCCIQ